MGISQYKTAIDDDFVEWAKKEQQMDPEEFRGLYFRDISVLRLTKEVCETILRIHALKQPELAEWLGVSTSTVKNRALREKPLRQETLRRLANWCGHELADFDANSFSPSKALGNLKKLSEFGVRKDGYIAIETTWNPESVSILAAGQLERHSKRWWEYDLEALGTGYDSREGDESFPEYSATSIYRLNAIASYDSKSSEVGPHSTSPVLSVDPAAEISSCQHILLTRGGTELDLMLFALDVGEKLPDQLLEFLAKSLRVFEETKLHKGTTNKGNRVDNRDHIFVALVYGDCGSTVLRSKLEELVATLPSTLRPVLVYQDPKNLLCSTGKEFAGELVKSIRFKPTPRTSA